MHLSAIDSSLEHFDDISNFNDLYNLVNILSIYETIEESKSNVPIMNNNPKKVQLDKVKLEAKSLIGKAIRDICIKANDQWSCDSLKLDKFFRGLYSCFLSDQHKWLFDVLVQADYEVDMQDLITTTFNDPNLAIISIIKKATTMGDFKEDYMWRRFFLFCYMEKKSFLKSLLVSF